jgi:signal transduction histidine kinase
MRDNEYILVIYSVLGIFLLVGLFMLIHFRNQRLIWKQRRQMQENELTRQKELLNAVIQSQEEERRRIGQDLHDQVGSSLSALRLLLHPRLNPGKTDPHSKELIDQMIRDVRDISHDLSPSGISMAGLYPTLKQFVALINRGGELQVVLEDRSHGQLDLLSEKTALALYRILTQLADNTLKHAGASRAGILFESQDDALHIHYADNGRGFDVELLVQARGIGMQNIQSRLQMIGAEYRFQSDNGFSLDIFLPISPLPGERRG